MRWTKDKPTQTGWYWYRGDYDAANWYTDKAKPVITFVNIEGRLTSRGRPPVAHAWQPFMDYDDELSNFTGEWAGPIEPPT